MMKHTGWPQRVLMSFLFIGIFLVTGLNVIGASEGQAQAGAAKQQLRIEIQSNFPNNRGITFFFNLPMIAEENLKTVAHPDITFAPAISGTWTWRTPKVLTFLPEEDALPCGNPLRVTIPSTFAFVGKEYDVRRPVDVQFQVDCPKPVEISVTPYSVARPETVFLFSLPMVPPDNFQTAKPPEVIFDPPQTGVFTWRSPTQLVFIPDAGPVPYGQEVKVSIPQAVPLLGERWALTQPWQATFNWPYFQIAGKVASWLITPGQPRFISLLNWHTGQVGRGPLFLLYDQPVSIERIATIVKVTDEEGRPLECEVFRPDDLSQVFEGEIDPNYVAAVRIIDLPSFGQSVTMQIPTWTQPDAPEMTTQYLRVNTKFQVAGRTVEPTRPDGRTPLRVTWYLEFTNSFRLEHFEQALHITPSPRGLSVRQGGWYNRAEIWLDLEPGTQYQAAIGRDFTDIFGNPLPDPIAFSFKTEDLAPILQVPTNPVVLEHVAKRLPIRIQNVESLEARVFRFSSSWEFSLAIEKGHQQNAKAYGLDVPSESFQIPVEAEPSNTVHAFDIPLNLAPGLMCIEVRAFGVGSEAEGILRDAILVQITDLGVTTKIFENKIFTWVTRLNDATPVPDARVALYQNGQRITESVTDESGVVSLDAKDLATAAGLQESVTVVAEKGGYIAVSRLVNDELSQAWQFGLKGKVAGQNLLPAAIFTERGAYRPGETVHLKAIVGKTPDLQGDALEVQIQDPRGQQLLKQTLPLDTFGSAALDVPLKAEAAVGEYLIQATLGAYTAIRKFRVEEYRVPTFQVSVKSEQPEWLANQDAQAIIRAAYLHGGTLDGRQVKWDVMRQPAAFTSAQFAGYVFHLGDANEFAGSVASGDTRLDGQGQTVIAFKPGHPSAAGPMRYTVEASVTDVDRQAYAGRLTRIVHPSAFYLGVLPPPREVLQAEETLNVPIVAVQPDGAVRENVAIQAQLERIDYHTTARLSPQGLVQLLNRAVPVAQQRYDLTTGAAPVNCAFRFPGAGLYVVRVTAQDEQRQAVQTGFFVMVAGDTSTAWPRFDQDRIEVVADKSEYKIGDVAKLIVQTPYKRAQGLLTIERDGVLSYRTFTISDDTPALEIPITAEYTPNVFVSVILLRGRMHHEKDATGFETGAPGFKIGYARLKVDPSGQRLDVQVAPAQKIAHPGQNMTVALQVKDASGKPVSGQATVMVVDEAVLGLTGYRTPDPVAQIYVERLLGVRTGASYLDLPHARRARREKVFPGGDQDQAQQTFVESDGLRKLFLSTAYWNPNVEVVNGQATVAFELPDNLTTYRIMAVVTDEARRVGSGDQQIVIRKPLMVQPVLPRFLYPNDELQIGALVFNGTTETGDVRLTAEFEGVQLAAGEAGQQATINPDASAAFNFPIKVIGTDKAIIRFKAQSGLYADAVEMPVPILQPGNARNIVVSKTVTGTDKIAITLPADRIPGSVSLEVVTSTTALSELKDSVQYLMGYPNGCIEQTTSTAYPLVVLKDLLPEIGIEVNQEDLKKFSEAGIKRILSFQTPAGGLSYWPGSPQPHAFATAFGLTALIEAKKRGYDVPDEALKGMADYLEVSLREGQIRGEMPHGGMADGDTRALFVMTLGRLGRPQPGHIAALWRSKDQLTPFGLSFLAIAVKEMGGEQTLLDAILADIRKAAQEEEKEAYYTGARKGGWSFDSPLRTQGGALIAYASSSEQGDMTGKLLTGLLSRRQGGLWGNTQENVFGIMGVYAAVGEGAGGDAPRLELKIQEQNITEAEMEKTSDRVRRLIWGESDLKLQSGKEETRQITLKNNGGAPIILTVRVQYAVPLTEPNRQAQAQGFTITRHYETLEGQALDNQPIPLGSLVRVRVQVKTDQNLHYVAIDDKLPAGLEPLNTSLETTEKVAAGTLTNTIQRSLSVLSYQEIRDARVAFYVDEMLAGEYEYSYVARATTPGRFLRPAGRVEAMYQPEIYGLTTIDEVEIK